jgi:hypothetical protein
MYMLDLERSQRRNIRLVLEDNDSLRRKQFSYPEFKNAIEKLDPYVDRNMLWTVFKDYLVPGEEKFYYEQFCDTIDDVRRKKIQFESVLKRIYDRILSNEKNIFDLLEAGDQFRDGTSDKNEMLKELSRYGIDLYGQDLENLVFFTDTGKHDGRLSHRELKKLFADYLKSIGKNIDELSRTAHLKGIQ